MMTGGSADRLDDQEALQSLLREYQDSSDNVSISSLLASSRKLKDSIVLKLRDHHLAFRNVEHRLTEIRSSYDQLNSSVTRLNHEAHNEVSSFNLF